MVVCRVEQVASALLGLEDDFLDIFLQDVTAIDQIENRVAQAQTDTFGCRLRDTRLLPKGGEQICLEPCPVFMALGEARVAPL